MVLEREKWRNPYYTKNAYRPKRERGQWGETIKKKLDKTQILDGRRNTNSQ